MVFRSVCNSVLPFLVCLACRACSLAPVIPWGTRVPGSHGTPINSPSKWEPLRHRDTGWSRWEEDITKKAEERWSGKGKMKGGEIMYFMFTCALLTICLSGSWQTACSLHYFFFSINLKVWTLQDSVAGQLSSSLIMTVSLDNESLCCAHCGFFHWFTYCLRGRQ